MELTVVAVIWIAGTAVVGTFAHWKGKSALHYALVSLLASPLLGILALLFTIWRSKDRDESREVAEKGEKDPKPRHMADTNILTPEQAEAMRQRAEREAPSASKEDMATFQNADTNVFTPEEMEAMRRAAREKT